MKSTLSPLQHRVLRALPVTQPPWTLTGGGALCGFHLGHRATEDLDLFFHGQTILGPVVREILATLSALPGTTHTVQTSSAFRRLVYREHGEEDLRIDIVAEPVPQVERPVLTDGILVDTRHEILVNKLCALLSRSEVRDLEDVRALIDAGEDLDRALADAPTKDGGFSPATLAYTLRALPLNQSERLGFDAERLKRFREALTTRLLSA